MLKKTFTAPTEKNPAMNVLLTEINDDPNRKAAAPAFNPMVKKEMNDLSAFYQSKFSVLDWSRVEEVDTRFKGQVICRLKED